MSDGQWVTAAAAAKAYGVHPRTIRKWIAAGKVTARMTPEGYLVELPAGMADARIAESRTAIATTEQPTIDLAPLAHLVEHLADDNARLSGEVAYWRHRAETAERQLTAGAPVIAMAASSEPPAPDGFWPRLRARLLGS